jgi:hypothetical protein
MCICRKMMSLYFFKSKDQTREKLSIKESHVTPLCRLLIQHRQFHITGDRSKRYRTLSWRQQSLSSIITLSLRIVPSRTCMTVTSKKRIVERTAMWHDSVLIGGPRACHARTDSGLIVAVCSGVSVERASYRTPHYYWMIQEFWRFSKVILLR